MNLSNRTAKSLSLEQLENSILCESVLALGVKLVDVLSLQPHDVLGQWMAHYVAEKLKLAKEATAENRTQRLSECYDEILKLWVHRRNFEFAQPLQSFDPIFRTLQCLDPDASTRSRFFDDPLEPDESESADCREWLDKAAEVERAACALIGHLVKNAALVAENQEAEWVSLAKSTELEDDALSLIELLDSLPADPESFKVHLNRLVAIAREALDNQK